MKSVAVELRNNLPESVTFDVPQVSAFIFNMLSEFSVYNLPKRAY